MEKELIRREAEEIMRLLDEQNIKSAMTQDGTEIGVVAYPEPGIEIPLYDHDLALTVVETLGRINKIGS